MPAYLTQGTMMNWESMVPCSKHGITIVLITVKFNAQLMRHFLNQARVHTQLWACAWLPEIIVQNSVYMYLCIYVCMHKCMCISLSFRTHMTKALTWSMKAACIQTLKAKQSLYVTGFAKRGLQRTSCKNDIFALNSAKWCKVTAFKVWWRLMHPLQSYKHLRIQYITNNKFKQ